MTREEQLKIEWCQYEQELMAVRAERLEREKKAPGTLMPASEMDHLQQREHTATTGMKEITAEAKSLGISIFS